MKKVQNPNREFFLRNYLTALLYTVFGLIISILAPILGIPVVFMAFGRMSGFSKWLAYVAVGLIIGPLIGLVSGLTGSVTGFLPGILGQVVGWILLGWIIVFVVGMILRFTGSRR